MINNFICGNIKFKTLEFKGKSIILPKHDKISAKESKQNEILQKKNIDIEESKKDETIVEEGKKLKLFVPTKQVHGFSGIIKNNKIFFSFHTTKPFSNIWGMKEENIEIGEELNPIKNVNIIQIMEKEEFLEYYKITPPQNMLKSPRYGYNKESDLAYCSYRALWKSILCSNKTITFEKVDKEIVNIISNDIFLGSDEGIILPAQAEVRDAYDLEDILSGINEGLQALDFDTNLKQELVTAAGVNYDDITKIFKS